MQDKETSPKNTHGGKRPGSGRKRGEPTVIIRVPKVLVNRIDRMVSDWKKIKKR